MNLKRPTDSTNFLQKCLNGEHEQACHIYFDYYVRGRENEFKFICIQNNMVSVIKQKIILWGDINAKKKMKFTHIRGFNFVCSMTPKNNVLLQPMKVVEG